MKMKKFAAVFAAAAVAVSAMATTISAAFNDQTLTYSLVEIVDVGDKSEGSVEIEKRLSNIASTISVDGGLLIALFDNTDDDEATKISSVGDLKLDTRTAAGRIQQRTYSADIDSVYYNARYAAAVENAKKIDGVLLAGFWIPIAEIEQTTSSAFDTQVADAVVTIQLKHRASDLKAINTALNKSIVDIAASAEPPVVARELDMAEDQLLFIVGSRNTSSGSREAFNGKIDTFSGNTATSWVDPTSPAGTTAAFDYVTATDLFNLPGLTQPRNFEKEGASKERKIPYRTNISPFTRPDYYYGGNSYDNILHYLAVGGNAGLVGGGTPKGMDGNNGRYYANVLSVVNDAIRNYDSVTFRFNTAAQPIRFDRIREGKDVNAIANASIWYYDDGSNANEDKYWRSNYYTNFGQHLYGLYSPWEGTWGSDDSGVGYDAFGWDVGFFNLFNAALVVNGPYTMSLADAQNFKYGATWIEFDLEDVYTPNQGALTASFTDYIHTLQLATSDYWFWDSMVIGLAAGEAENVDSGEGIGDDVDEIGDDDGDDDIFADDDWGDDDWGDDDFDEPAPAPAPAPNPPTGNAPIALAVIPVALAAAAIVIKKRK